MKKLIIIPAIISFMACGCASSGNDRGQSLTPATDLSESIDKAIEKGCYEEALSLIDSLRHAYPDSIELRKLTQQQAAKANDGLLMSAIPEADRQIALCQAATDSLSRYFKTVVSSQTTGSYMLEKSLDNSSFLNSTSVQPRIGNDDMPWLLAINVSGKKIEPDLIELVDDRGNIYASAANPQAVSTSITDGKNQMLIWPGHIAGDIPSALEQMPDKSFKLKIKGTAGETVVPLSRSLATAIVRTYRYAQARTGLQQALINREKIERKLIVARNQKANLDK